MKLEAPGYDESDTQKGIAVDAAIIRYRDRVWLLKLHTVALSVNDLSLSDKNSFR